MVTSSVEGGTHPVVIVHLSTTAPLPAVTLVTVVLKDAGFVMTAPPPPGGETKDHVPVPKTGLLAAMTKTALLH